KLLRRRLGTTLIVTMSCERPAFPGTPHEHLLWDAIRPSLRFPLLTANERYRGEHMKRLLLESSCGSVATFATFDQKRSSSFSGEERRRGGRWADGPLFSAAVNTRRSRTSRKGSTAWSWLTAAAIRNASTSGFSPRRNARQSSTLAQRAMATNTHGSVRLWSKRLPRAPLTVARMTFVPWVQALANISS